jgi:gliding motility-associated-like protein
MKKFTLMFFMMLLSLCSYAQLPTEGFETWPVPGGGWATYQNNIGPTQWQQGTVSLPGYNSPSSAYMQSQPVPPPGQPIDYLRTPAFNVPTAPKLMFMSRFVQGGIQGNIVDVMIAKVSDNATGDPALGGYQSLIDADGYTEAEMNTQQQVWTLKEFDIPASYVNQQVYIVFVYKSVNSSERWLIDDVRVVQECLAPTFTVTNPGTTTLQLNITANPSNAASFVWEWTLANGNPDGTHVGTFTGNTTTITGLTEDTDYKIYVYAVCAADNPSDVVGPVAASTVPAGTTCAAPKVVPGIPYQTTDNTIAYGDDIEGSPGTTGCGTTGSFLNGNEVVYSYTPDFTGNVSIAMTNNGAASGMFVYTSCANVGVSCAAGGTGNATTPVNIPSFAVTAGSTYYIVISTSGATVSTPYTLTIQAASCPPPTALGVAAGSVTSDGATLIWTDAAAITSWQYVVQPAGTGIPTASTPTSTATANSWPVSGLNQATNYEFYVRGDCNNGTFSAWAGPFAFTTTQIPAGLNYTQDFETPAHNWTLSNGTQANQWVVGSAVNNGGAQSLYISNNGGAANAYTVTTASTVHAFRDFTVPAGTYQLQLTFDWKGQGEGPNWDYVRVWSVPTTFNPTPGTLITATTDRVNLTGNLNLQADWTTATYTIPAAAFAGSTRRIIFEWRNDGTGGTQPPAAIDNINLNIVTCSVPTAVTMGTVNSGDATISWTAPVPGAESYDYYYSTTNTPPTASTVPNGNTAATSVNIAPLDPSTQYYFWVRSNCGPVNGVSLWTGPTPFLTPQIPATLNYVEDFEGTSQWTLNNGTQTNKWVIGTAVANGGTHSMYISSNNGTGNIYNTGSATTVQAYRDFTIPAGTNVQVDIAFDWRAVGETANWDYFRVWVVPVTFNPTPGTQITAATGPNGRQQLGGNFNGNNQWINASYVYTTTNATPVQKRIVFEWRNDGGGGTQPPAAIDNVDIMVVTCPKPTTLAAANATQTTVDLTWTETGTATNWEVYVVPTGDPAPTAATTGTPTNDNTAYTYGPLAPGTVYQYYVRSVCGPTDKSRWVGPFQFQTECTAFPVTFQEGFNSTSPSELCWTVLNANNDADSWNMNYTVTPYEGNQVATLTTDGNGTGANANNDYLITPQILLTGNQRLRFRYKVQSASEPNKFQVLLSTTGKNPADFTQVVVPVANYSNVEYAVSTTPLVDGSGNGLTGPVYIAFHVPGGGPDGWRLYIDNVIVENLPACPEVVNLEANCVSSAGANIEWTAGSTETSWEVAVLPSTSATPTSGTIVTSPSYIAQNLTSETAYTAYVRPICPNGQPGNWETIGFVTPETSILDAQPFCAATNGEYILFDNVDDSDNAQEYGQVACLGSTPNPVWYYLQVDDPGNLNFQLIQNTQFNSSGNPTGTGLDVDFVAWGPFTSTTEACNLIELVDCPTCPNNTGNPNFYPFGNIIDCSYSAAAIETLSIDNAQTGQIYVLLITNFNGDPGQIKLQQLASSTGNTNCNILYSVNLGPDINACGSANTTLTATVTTPGNSQAPTYQWFMDGSTPITPTVVAQTPLSQTVQITEPGSHVYSVVVTVPNAANTTPITDQATVVIGPAVNVPNPAGLILCDPSGTATVDLAAQVPSILGSLNPADYIVEYYMTEADATAGTVTPIDQAVPFSTSSQTIWVRVESSLLGDCFDVVPFPIVVNTTPTASISYTGTPFCSNAADATVTLTGTGGTFSAAPVTGTTGTLVIDAATGTINVAGSTPGTYNVTYTIPASNSCPPVDATTQVTITPAPVANFTYDQAQYCQNAGPQTVTFDTGAVAGTFTATPAGLAIDPVTGTITPGSSSVGVYEVRNTIAAANGCGSVFHAFTVTINLAPVATFHYAPDTYCANQGTAAPVLDGIAGTFSAEPAGLVINNTTGVVDLDASAPGTYVVSNAIAATPNCAAYGETASITIVAVPDLTYSQGCEGNNYIVEVLFDGDPVYTEDNVTIVWTNPAGIAVGSDAQLTVTTPGIYTATVTPVAGVACPLVIPVDVDDTSCMIQRGISPNGDGLNDTFDLSALNVRKLSIFNRYGKEVYSYGNYTNQWHGQGDGGSELPTGTYFYMIERATGEQSTGWIYINREE